MRKTHMLSGSYNNKQKDDFMTPVQSTPTSVFLCMFSILLLLFSICQPVMAADGVAIMPSDTLDYYIGVGEPELAASLRGSNELGKGESAVVQITLVNKGVLQGVYYKEYISSPPALIPSDHHLPDGGVNSLGEPTYTTVVKAINFKDYEDYMTASMAANAQLQLAGAERSLEAARIHAESLNIQFECDSPYIEIETGKDYVFLNSLYSGSSGVVTVPVSISPNAPTGEYLLNITIDYSYPSNAKMLVGMTSFLYPEMYIQEYQTKQIRLQLPFYIASGPVFEVTSVEGSLDAGKTNTVSVTYTNVGDETAYNAESKIDMMYPLSSASNKALLGDVAPGESITIDYPVKAHSSALPKVYGINSNVRYYNDNDKLQITPGMKVNVELIDKTTILTFKNILIGTFLLVVFSLSADYLRNQRKKKNDDNS